MFSSRTTQLRMLAIVLAAAAVLAGAQPVLGPSLHGWVAIGDTVIRSAPVSDGGESALSEDETDAGVAAKAAILLHLPPRVPTAGASPAPELRVARVARLTTSPEWLIPVGESVYAIMPADDGGVSRVGRSRVYPRGLRDLWGADPARRLEVLPVIEGAVLAVTSDGNAPIAATQTETGIQLLRLEGSAWEPVGPPLVLESTEYMGLLWQAGVPVVVTMAGGAAAWSIGSDQGWDSTNLALPAWLDLSSLRVVGSWNNELILTARSSDRHTAVASLSHDAVRELGRIPPPRLDGTWDAAAIIADPGRLVLVSTDADATEDAQTSLPSPGLKQHVVTMAEFSLVTGTLLALGEATASSPVSRNEVQSLAILLVAAMLVVLVVVVRPSPVAAEPVLPPGTAIATNGRRFVSSVTDLVPSIFVTSVMLDLTFLETLGPIALLVTGSVDLMPLLMVLSITAMHCAAGEMLTGRSLGKMLTGIFVARVDPVPGAPPEAGRFRPPTPAGAMLRNIMKWFLFPATAIVLSDPSGRHRGDLIAKSAVLMPVVESHP